MQIRSGQEDMQARGCRGFQSLNSRSDVLFLGARQRRNRHIAHFLCHQANGVQISARSDGETRLDYVYTQSGKLSRHADFLRGIHGKAGRLLAIAQRSVKNAYGVHKVSLTS
jgi:hypothetical protein